MGFEGAFSTSVSQSSGSSNQSANNQDFSEMFGDKNLGKTDYVIPSAIVAGYVFLYVFLKGKKLV